MKNLLIKDIPESLYYKLLELKAKYRCGTWIDFLKKIVEKDESP